MREEFGIGLSGEVYERPVHLQPYFEGEYAEGSLPVAERICARHICLPVFQGLGEDDCRKVVEALAAALELQYAAA